jgi:hypothetical protein
MFKQATFFMAGVLTAATIASAELPAVLNHMPANGIAAVIIPSLDRLDTNISALAAAVEAPLPATPKQGLAMMGLREGLDTSRPIAMFLSGDMQGADIDPDELLDQMVILLPTTDFNAMVAQFNAQVQDGVSVFEINGSPAYARAIGAEYAALSPSMNAAKGFAPGANLDAVRRMLGPRGVELAERSDAFMVVNVERIAELAKAGFAEAREEMEGQAMMMAMMTGQDPEQIQQTMEQGFALVESFVNDASGAVMGANLNALGVSFDFATSFKQGTQWAGYFGDAGNASNLLRRLPDMPFIMAFASDYSAPGINALLKQFADIQKDMGNMPGFPGMDLAGMINNLQGQSMAIYPGPAGIMGGLLSGAVAFNQAKDPAAMRAQIRETLEAVAQMQVEGMQMTGTFTPESVDAGGVKADSWSLAFGGEAMQNPMGMQAMAMIFGPGAGPNGLIAQTRDGVYTTYSQNPASLIAAMNAGEGSSLADNRMLSQVASRLPSNRTMEGYLGVQSIVDQAAPFAAMFMGPINLGAGGNMPPIGMGVSTGGSSFHFGLFVPTPIIQTAVRVATEVQQMQQGGNQGGGGPPF